MGEFLFVHTASSQWRVIPFQDSIYDSPLHHTIHFAPLLSTAGSKPPSANTPKPPHTLTCESPAAH